MADGGSLEWAIKDSFLDYVRALDDGDVSAEDGARRVEHGFVFPAAPRGEDGGGAPGSAEGSVERFTGTVSLRGHGQLLAVDIIDPWLEFDESGGRLTIAGPRPGTPRLAVARIDVALPQPSEESRLWRVAEPTLTFDGTYWLGGYYEEGTVLAPLLVRLPGRAA